MAARLADPNDGLTAKNKRITSHFYRKKIADYFIYLQSFTYPIYCKTWMLSLDLISVQTVLQKYPRKIYWHLNLWKYSSRRISTIISPLLGHSDKIIPIVAIKCAQIVTGQNYEWPWNMNIVHIIAWTLKQSILAQISQWVWEDSGPMGSTNGHDMWT
jgi:hypothetical protein